MTLCRVVTVWRVLGTTVVQVAVVLERHSLASRVRSVTTMRAALNQDTALFKMEELRSVSATVPYVQDIRVRCSEKCLLSHDTVSILPHNSPLKLQIVCFSIYQIVALFTMVELRSVLTMALYA